MRVYNGTKSQVDLPLAGTQRITIPAHSVSGDIMPSTEFLSLLVTSYDYSELALIVSGPFEINLCASVTGSVGFVVQSLDEAIERFAPKTETPKVVEETKPSCSVCGKTEETCTCDKEEEKENCACPDCDVKEDKEEEETATTASSKETKKSKGPKKAGR